MFLRVTTLKVFFFARRKCKEGREERISAWLRREELI